ADRPKYNTFRPRSKPPDRPENEPPGHGRVNAPRARGRHRQGARRSRTPASGTSPALRDDQVQQPVRDEDRLPDRLAVHEATDVLVLHGEGPGLVLADPARHRHPRPDLAVDLDHELHLVRRGLGRVERGPERDPLAVRPDRALEETGLV